MANLFDYIDWRGDLSIRQDPFNEVDNLVLSTLAYVPLEGAAPAPGEGSAALEEVAGRFFSDGRERELRDRKDADLLAAVAGSPRFRAMGVSRCVSRLDPEAEEQFGAVTFSTGDGASFVAYRGTDNSLVGWKEDFNMGFKTPVPSQTEAADYLRQTAWALPGTPLRLGGHSKGGNLAVYAAAHCGAELRPRLLEIYNNDGPGFVGPVLDSEGYRAVRERVRTFVPQSSVVGMLLDHDEAYEVIHSAQRGVLQHDPYSWEMVGARFVRMAGVDGNSRMMDHTLRGWIYSMDEAERERFVDALYEIVSASEAATLPELASDWLHSAGRVLRKLRDMDPASRRVVQRALFQLFRSARDSIPAVWFEYVHRRGGQAAQSSIS